MSKKKEFKQLNKMGNWQWQNQEEAEWRTIRISILTNWEIASPRTIWKKLKEEKIVLIPNEFFTLRSSRQNRIQRTSSLVKALREHAQKEMGTKRNVVSVNVTPGRFAILTLKTEVSSPITFKIKEIQYERQQNTVVDNDSTDRCDSNVLASPKGLQ